MWVYRVGLKNKQRAIRNTTWCCGIKYQWCGVRLRKLARLWVYICLVPSQCRAAMLVCSREASHASALERLTTPQPMTIRAFATTCRGW
jgi:hypothetical protein